MSHNYLFDTHAYIQQRLAEARRRLAQADGDPDGRPYAAGQVQALRDFQHFMIDNFNAKLPRRLRSKVADKGSWPPE